MSNQKSYLPVKYLDNNIVLSDSEAWVYVLIPNVSYEFLTDQDRLNIMDQMTITLANLTTASQEELDVHMRVIHKPFPYASWYKNLAERTERNNPAPGWDDYSGDMFLHVASNVFYQKKVYLGVKLGDRSKTGAVSASKKDVFAEIIAPLKRIVSVAEEKAGYNDYSVSQEEVEHWTKQALSVRRSLRESYLRAEPVSSEDLAWVIANPLWPSMPQPEVTYSNSTVWGEGELAQLVDGIVTVNYKSLEVEQTFVSEKLDKAEDFSGHVAFLSVSRFPDSLLFPSASPWIYTTESSFSFPVDFSIRMSIVPPAKVKKDVSRKLADAKDQAQHIAETGAGVPLNIREQVETATTLEYIIDKERMPWAYSRIRLIVTAETEEELKARCKSIIEEYREFGMDISWPSGDQFNLLLEVTPGSKVRVPSYLQRQDLAVVPGGLPHASSDVGDVVVDGEGWLGPYIGYTTLGSMSPMFFSPHSSIAKDKPPGVAIIGSPGGGKALALNTPILTADGCKTMGTLRIGDRVYGPDGELCNIVDKTNLLIERPCYEIEFRDGTTIIADASHEWVVNVVDDSAAESSENLFNQILLKTLPEQSDEKNNTTTTTDHNDGDLKGGRGLSLNSVKMTTAELFQRQVFHGEHTEPLWFKLDKSNNVDITTKGTVRYVIPSTNPLRFNETPQGLDNTPQLHHIATVPNSTETPDRVAVFKGSTLIETFETFYTAGFTIFNENQNSAEHATSNSHHTDVLPTEDLSNATVRMLTTPQVKGGLLDVFLNAEGGTTQSSHQEVSTLSTKVDLVEVVRSGNLFTRTALLQGIIDAYGLGTSDSEDGKYENGVLSLPNSEEVGLVLELFSNMGYITQHGSNDETFINDFLLTYGDGESRNSHNTTEREETAYGDVFVAYSYDAPHEIVSIKPTKSVPVQCIQVDNEEHMYLAGESLIPTHNSFLAFKLAYDMAMQGVWTIYIDPKADAKPMGDIKGLGNVRVFDLRYGNEGMLDPFSIGDSMAQKKLLALETLRLILGSFSEEREEVLVDKIEQVSRESSNPSLSQVVDALMNDTKTEISRNLGRHLNTIRGLEFARLCFAPSTGATLRPEDGLTIVTLLGLDLPDATTETRDYSYDNRLAVGVMHLLTKYARQLMLNMDKSHPKAICVDEAWAITSTPQGRKLIPEIARMGRSHNTALVLVSQNAGDLMEQAVTNSISTKFAFRSQNRAEIYDVLGLLGLPQDREEYIRSIIGLRKGQCIVQDSEGRTAKVVVDVKDWNQELFEAFNTNPETRGKKIQK